MSLSKKVVKAATGARRDQYVDLLYDSLIKETSNYGVTSDPQLLAYLAQIGHETGGLNFMEELASGAAYEGRKDLGNTEKGDGVKYKGRGLIQLTGKTNYGKADKFLETTFKVVPSEVSPTNQQHKTSGGRVDEYDNAVKSSLWFWRKGSAWGDLNKYASQIDLEKGLLLGKNFDVNRLPDKTSQALGPPFNLQRRKGGSNPANYKGFFLVDYLGLDREGDGKSLYMFELISLGINGGYNGFKDRYIKFEAGRKALLGDDYIEPVGGETGNGDGGETGNGDDDTTDDINENDGTNREKDSIEQFESITGIQNIIAPTIDLKPIEFGSDGDKKKLSEIGKKPLIWFNDVQIDVISKFRISSSGFLPTLYLEFKDNYSFYDNLRFPNDDARIRVFISSRSELLRPIYCEFKVTSFNKMGQNEYKLEGILNVNRMYVSKVESFNNSTSFEVLKKIAQLSKLGYSVNVNGTSDNMTWINPGDRVMEFSKDVIKRSYRSDQSFMYGFVDFYYNLNFLDIEEQLNFDLTKQTGILTGGLNEIQDKLALGKENEALYMYLTNDQSSSTTPNYFESYKIFNSSTSKSIKEGYNNRVKYYDWQSKELLIFNMGTITNDDNVILKAEDDEFFKENIKQHWEGRLLSNNAHGNYHFANIQNNININEIQKIGIEVILPNPNFNLYRFMKIYVLLLNQGITEINPLHNKKLSGEWLIIDIQLYFDGGAMKQKVKMIRRDLGFSQEEVSG